MQRDLDEHGYPRDRVRHQRALNEVWPRNARGERVASVRDYPDRPGIKVRARVVWESSGEEWVDGTATRWDAHHVFVRLGDDRCQTEGFWLRPADVERRAG